jgi:nucleoside-diphosphate-sugar epimerase
MKKLLFTGATGFIGRHCLPFLLEKGYEVHAVSSRGSVDDFPNIHWQRADLLDPGQVFGLMARVKPSHLLHFAWVTTPGSYWTSAENLRWVRASLDLLEAFAKNGGRRAVMAGTCAEYDWQYGYCSEQITPVKPSTMYGICKHSFHIMEEAFARQTDLQTAWGRVFFLYGPHEYPDRLISSVIRALLKGEPARCSHGKQIRDFLYVQDIAEAFVTLLESQILGAVNVASGYPIAIKDVINKIAEKLGRRDLVELGALPVSEHEPHLLVADVSRLTNEVGWVPKYDLDRGLEQTINWWKDHLLEKENESAK